HFYRFSNLRVLTHTMQLAKTFEEPRVWRPVSEEQHPAPPDVKDIDRCLAQEHDDWLAYYTEGGWTYDVERDEGGKRHEMLLPFSAFDEVTRVPKQDIERRIRGIVTDAFELLAVLGYNPYLASSTAENLLPLAERRPARW